MIIEMRDKEQSLLATFIDDKDNFVLGNNEEIWCLLERTQSGFKFFDLGSPDGIYKNNQKVFDGQLTEQEPIQINGFEYRIVSYVNDLKNYFEFSDKGQLVAAMYTNGQFDQLYLEGGFKGLFEIKDNTAIFHNGSQKFEIEKEIKLDDMTSVVFFYLNPVDVKALKEKSNPKNLALMLAALASVFVLPFIGKQTQESEEDFYRKQQKIVELKRQVVKETPKVEKIEKIVEKVVETAKQTAKAKSGGGSGFAKLLSVAATATSVSKQVQAAIPSSNQGTGIPAGLGVKVSQATQVNTTGGGGLKGNAASLAKGVSMGSGKGSGSGLLSLDGESEVEGGLDRDIVAQVIAKHINQIRNCYEAGLVQNQNMAGKVKMDFTIVNDGTVGTSKVSDSSLGSDYVHNCMTQVVKTWKFPTPKLGKPVRVVYPFLLRKVN